MPRSGRKRLPLLDRGRDGFNEAGAIMPRSGSRVYRVGTARSSGFNEAGAIMPRSGRTLWREEYDDGRELQ